MPIARLWAHVKLLNPHLGLASCVFPWCSHDLPEQLSSDCLMLRFPAGILILAIHTLVFCDRDLDRLLCTCQAQPA